MVFADSVETVAADRGRLLQGTGARGEQGAREGGPRGWPCAASRAGDVCTGGWFTRSNAFSELF